MPADGRTHFHTRTTETADSRSPVTPRFSAGDQALDALVQTILTERTPVDLDGAVIVDECPGRLRSHTELGPDVTLCVRCPNERHFLAIGCFRRCDRRELRTTGRSPFGPEPHHDVLALERSLAENVEVRTRGLVRVDRCRDRHPGNPRGLAGPSAARTRQQHEGGHEGGDTGPGHDRHRSPHVRHRPGGPNECSGSFDLAATKWTGRCPRRNRAGHHALRHADPVGE